MQTIKTFGDSFLYGSDLADAYDETLPHHPKHTPSRSVWPALIANKLGMKYQCHAHAGASNSAIARSIYQHAQPDTMNVIQWTWIDRTEYVNTEDNTWQQIRPSVSDQASENYYKNFHSTLQDKWINLNIIINALQYLESNNITYVCHALDQLLLDTKYHAPQYIVKQQNYLQDRIKWFPDNRTFFEWAKMEKFDISDGWHPLEQAHEQAAEIWQDEYERHCK